MKHKLWEGGYFVNPVPNGVNSISIWAVYVWTSEKEDE